MTDPSTAAKAAAHAEAAKDNFDWPHTLARVIEEHSNVVGAACSRIRILLPMGTPDDMRRETQEALDALQCLILRDGPCDHDPRWSDESLRWQCKHCRVPIKFVEDKGDD